MASASTACHRAQSRDTREGNGGHACHVSPGTSERRLWGPPLPLGPGGRRGAGSAPLPPPQRPGGFRRTWAWSSGWSPAEPRGRDGAAWVVGRSPHLQGDAGSLAAVVGRVALAQPPNLSPRSFIFEPETGVPAASGAVRGSPAVLAAGPVQNGPRHCVAGLPCPPGGPRTQPRPPQRRRPGSPGSVSEGRSAVTQGFTQTRRSRHCPCFPGGPK